MANAWMIKPLALPVVASSNTGVGAAGNVGNDYAGVVWQSTAEPNVDLIIDLGVDVPIDTIMLFGVELAPAAAQMQVFASTSAAGPGFEPPSWADVPRDLYAGSVLPVSGKGVSVWTAPAGFPAAVRFLLLRVTNGSGVSVRVARAVIGTRIQLDRNFSFGGAFGVRDLGSLDFNRRGVMSRNRGKKMRTLGLTFSHISKDEVEAMTKPLIEQIGNTEMIALVTDPAVDAQRQNRCYYGPLVGDLSNTWRNARAWEAKINLVSIF